MTALMAVLLLVCIPVKSSAAETKTIDGSGRSLSISVKAVFKENSDPNVYKNNVSGGSSSITTRNGITVTVTGGQDAFKPGVRLVVREITAEEKDAYDWFSGVMKDTGASILPFDIYFEKDGQRIPLNVHLQIAITLPDGYTAPLVCYVGTDGNADILSSSVKGGKILFETDYTGYFVVADKIQHPDIPRAGDHTNRLLYSLWLAYAAGFLMFMTTGYKKQRKR